MAEIGSGNNSSYPGAIDTNTQPEINSPAAGKTKARKEPIEDLTDAVIKIETELGTDPAGSLADVKTFLQTHHQTNGTHKTTHGPHVWIDAADYSTLTDAANAAIGKTLVISSSINLTLAEATGGAVVIPATVLGVFPMAPGVINKNTATSFTCNAPVVGNPMHQWLSGFAAGEVTFKSIPVIYPEWWGAKPWNAVGGFTDSNSSASTGAIQCAIDAAGGTQTVLSGTDPTSISGGGVGPHTTLEFSGGAYTYTVEPQVKPGGYLTIKGAGKWRTFLYNRNGSGAGLKTSSSFYKTEATARKYTHNDGGCTIKSLSLGSTSGHALSLVGATWVELDIGMFAAYGTGGYNYADLDGCQLITGIIQTLGNRDLPTDLTVAGGPLNGLGVPGTRGVNGLKITTRPDVNGNHYVSGQIYLQTFIQGQPTEDAIVVDTPVAPDFAIYPVVIKSGGDLIIASGYSLLKADRCTVTIEHNYGEPTAGGTVDAVNIVASHGDTTVYVNDFIAPSCRLNRTGNASYNANLYVRGGQFVSLVDAGNPGDLDIEMAKINGTFKAIHSSTKTWQPLTDNTNATFKQAPSGSATSASHTFYGTSNLSNEYLAVGTNIVGANENSLVSAAGGGTARPLKLYKGTTLYAEFLNTTYFLEGAGSPEGAVVASIGSLYRRTDGAAGTCLYVKESGTGNTGWVAK